MDLRLKKGRVAVEHTSDFFSELPKEGISLDTNPVQDQEKTIHEVEG